MSASASTSDAFDGEARRRALSTRDGLQALIAEQLAASHGRAWASLPEDYRTDYLLDAAALIDQGMTPWWEDHTPPANPPAAMEADLFEFDRSMEWFMSFLDARHPEWTKTGLHPSALMEMADPVDWDAWVTISVAVSEEVRQLWSQRFAAQTGEAPPATQAPPLPVPASAPASTREVRLARFAAAIGAVLANRHRRRWMDVPSDLKAAYLKDAYSLMNAGLTYSI